jgi:DNA replication and repair protein RecF
LRPPDPLMTPARPLETDAHSPAAESPPRSSAEHTIVLGFERASRRKRVTVDGAEPSRLSDALGSVPSVTFSPTDVDLVRGPPVGRRRYLDVVLATTSRRYLAALQNYRGALVRRNAALRALVRRPPVAQSALDAALGAWEPLLAESGAVLWAERASWAGERADELDAVCAAIGERDPLRMRFTAAAAAASRSREQTGGKETGDTEPRGEGQLREVLAVSLEASRAADLRHGSTRVGPHRDDLVLWLGDRDLRTYGSAGQQRTAAIGLRILEAATIRSRVGVAPVLLFDDPFAELDERRSRAILDVLAGGAVAGVTRSGPIDGQVILAVPRAADIPPGLTRLDRVRIRDGSISRTTD